MMTVINDEGTLKIRCKRNSVSPVTNPTLGPSCLFATLAQLLYSGVRHQCLHQRLDPAFRFSPCQQIKILPFEFLVALINLVPEIAIQLRTLRDEVVVV